MTHLIHTESALAGVSVVSLNRPERRNALSIDLMQALCAEIERLAQDLDQRVAILRGNGPVFSAGLDLLEAADTARAEESALWVERTLRLLRETPLITLCAVHGGAFAGGAGVMAACDIVLAAENAMVGFPEAQRGLLPALITEVLRSKVSDGNLRELFLAGEAVNAHRAQQMGLVQRVVPAEQLPDETLSVAKSILKGGPETIRRTKQLLNEYPKASDPAEYVRAIHLQARQSDEAHEGLMAFREKRPPRWCNPDS